MYYKGNYTPFLVPGFYYLWVSYEVDEIFLGQSKIKFLNQDAINCKYNKFKMGKNNDS